ncbi:MAG: SIMPL domain-containing protein [Bdellovibrionaceae bacterium]|nr:SIMPL domain-containing protein [Pseudobdellovibrionaceae bacterium]MBX3032331.1 SIMPL domain-containing protein [Pseudobdellovibrionaceae bacterium]
MSSLILSAALSAEAAREDARTIQVTAFAERAVDPDLLNLNIEVWSKAATAQRTQTLAADETKRVMALLEQYKIRKEDIRTDSFSFGPDYVWDPNRNQNKINGYRSSQVLRVTLRKIDQAGKFIDAMTVAEKGDGSGPRPEFGTTVSALQWDTSKKSELETESLGDAVKKARRKADEIAKAAGIKIKSVYRISHEANPDDGAPRPYEMKMARAALGADSSGTGVAEGQIKIRVAITAEYSF